MEDRAASDTEFGERLTAAHARYGAERDTMGVRSMGRTPPVEWVGRRGVKCLHAHYADFRRRSRQPRR